MHVYAGLKSRAVTETLAGQGKRSRRTGAAGLNARGTPRRRGRSRRTTAQALSPGATDPGRPFVGQHHRDRHGAAAAGTVRRIRGNGPGHRKVSAQNKRLIIIGEAGHFALATHQAEAIATLNAVIQHARAWASASTPASTVLRSRTAGQPLDSQKHWRRAGIGHSGVGRWSWTVGR